MQTPIDLICWLLVICKICDIICEYLREALNRFLINVKLFFLCCDIVPRIVDWHHAGAG